MKVNARGQIIIPKHLRERYGLHKGVEVEFVPREYGILMRKRAEGDHPVDRMYGIAKIRGANSVDELIEEMRGR